MKKNILCIGHSVLDQIFTVEKLPSKGKNFATSFLEVGGGPAATASVAVARLGQRATLWTRLGDDPAGDRIVKELESYGVSLKGTMRTPGASSALAAVAVDAKGERLILGYVDPKLPQDVPGWLPLGDLGNFDCVLADMRWPAAAAAALKKAKTLSIPTVTDADLVPDVSALQELVPLADHVVFSEGGLKMYSGEKYPEAALKKVAAAIEGIPYVTMGDMGCLWWDKEEDNIRFVPAFKVTVMDTTGAGDVFHGAFALALAEGMTQLETVKFASAAAALKCTRMGGRSGIPDRATLNSYLEGFE